MPDRKRQPTERVTTVENQSLWNKIGEIFNPIEDPTKKKARSANENQNKQLREIEKER